MAFKMSQEFPTASMDITKDFHILHSAYTVLTYTLVISSSKQKYTTDSLTHTHTHTYTHTHTHTRARARATATTTNKNQLDTSHRLPMVI